MTDWLTDWFIDNNDFKNDCLIDRPSGRLTDGLTDWLIDKNDLLTDSQTNCLTD